MIQGPQTSQTRSLRLQRPIQETTIHGPLEVTRRTRKRPQPLMALTLETLGRLMRRKERTRKQRTHSSGALMTGAQALQLQARRVRRTRKRASSGIRRMIQIRALLVQQLRSPNLRQTTPGVLDGELQLLKVRKRVRREKMRLLRHHLQFLLHPQRLPQPTTGAALVPKRTRRRAKKSPR